MKRLARWFRVERGKSNTKWHRIDGKRSKCQNVGVREGYYRSPRVFAFFRPAGPICRKCESA